MFEDFLKRKPKGPKEMSWTFEGDLQGLEIARGHDGLLRGVPEPVVLFALYASNGTTVQVVGRTLHKFKVTDPFPSVAKSLQVALPRCTIDTTDPPYFIALAIALEADGGKDVQRLYGALEHYRELLLWQDGLVGNEPVSLAALPTKSEWSVPISAELLLDHAVASSGCTSDKWIGATCWVMRARERKVVSIFRLAFRSRDARNDWTAVVNTRF